MSVHPIFGLNRDEEEACHPARWRPEDDYAVFVELLATVRREKKVTQSALAERLGRLQTLVAKAEARSRRIDAVELIAILDTLRVDPAAFITRLRRQFRKKKGH